MKKYYLIIGVSMLLLSCTWKTKTGSELPLIGAIRWDGWSGGPAEVNYILHRTLVYAWNEFDEGGWLAPTLSDGTKRIEAISKVIKKYKK